MNELDKKYEVIYADPPWLYRDKANSGKRGASHQYKVMTAHDISRLPVDKIAADQCILFMWHVPTQPMEALKVMEAWGFRLMNMKGFTWGKHYKKATDKLCIGMGHMTRANSEDCLIAVKGKLPERLDASICQLIMAPRGANSEKPAIFRDKIVELLGDLPRIELFARGEDTLEGWDCFGNEYFGDNKVVYDGSNFVMGREDFNDE
ncbi:adenine methylase [Vibrio owensii]|uniref:Adenine methylase n=1 Tax=Vibrio owensii TaxID=696485 RepID=A0AAP9KC68_9VIBR|nr:MT-A70 family methyltransferase [Vibrio owensii]AYO17046.1 adenine methylase [Vibrio owensii]QGH49195.1 adenine methylase [Vibrio owensii]